MAEQAHPTPRRPAVPPTEQEESAHARPVEISTLDHAVQALDQELERQCRVHADALAVREALGGMTMAQVMHELTSLDARRATLAAEVGALEARLVALRAEVTAAEQAEV